MANENWHLLGDKLRNYRPPVDADVAWQNVSTQLNIPAPRLLSLRRLLGWKVAELGLIVLSLFLLNRALPETSAPADPGNSTEIQSSLLLARVPGAADATKEAAATLPATSIRPQEPAKRALTPAMDRTTDLKSAKQPFRDARPRNTDTASPSGNPLITARSDRPELSRSAVDRSPSETKRLRANGPIDLLPGSLPQELIAAEGHTVPAFSTTQAVAMNASASVRLEILGGISQTASARTTPFAGVQLRFPTGPRGVLVLGAAYQRVAGMNLHWRQAEYDKDFGYPTGNVLERWLDSYGAWEYSIGYRQQIAGRWSVQTDVQLTILQERGLRERIQGSDFFLGSSRRSLVDRDFGVRLGLDYRLSRHLALYGQYLYGLGDISPDYLYQDQRVHRHGGWRVGLRLMPFQ